MLVIDGSARRDRINFKRFRNVDMTYEVREGDDISTGDNVTVQVTLERDMTNLPSEVGPVHAPRFPKPKEEGWWLVIGDSSTNQLLAIKRVALQKRARVKLEFSAPALQSKQNCSHGIKCNHEAAVI
jgi:pre-mRNA-splicing helicase BRR2